MKNMIHHKIIENAIKYKLNPEYIIATPVHVVDDQWGVNIEVIFDVPVGWPIEPFEITEVYEYFDKKLGEYIGTHLFAEPDFIVDVKDTLSKKLFLQ